MPERDHFPKEYFEGNPYEGTEPEQAYQRLRWGNEAKETFEIESPEPLATLGDVAKIFTPQGTVEFSESEAPYLAVGTYSNLLYFVPKVDGKPVHIPMNKSLRLIGNVTRIDYYSDKGSELAYYYHNHEPPYPFLYQQVGTGVCVLVPAECPDGSRSYAVGDEGVIG